MTDARFPDRWLTDRRIQRLSDAQFRSYINALVWSVGNRTDGLIEPTDLALIPNFAEGAPKAFINAGLWIPQKHGWLIADYQSTQTSRSEIEALERVRARERQQKARQRAQKAAKREAQETTAQGVCPGDSPRDMSTGQVDGLHRQGKARQGQARTGRRPDQETTAAEREEKEPTAAGANNGHRPSSSEWRGIGPDPYDEYR